MDDLSGVRSRAEKLVLKVWGAEYWLVNNRDYCAKLLELNSGYQCSKHYHRIKKETFIVLDGEVRLELWPPKLDPFVLTLLPGQRRTILPETAHRFSPVGGGATILEVSTEHSDEDVVRLEESRAI